MLGSGMLEAGTPAYSGRSLRVVMALPSMKNFWLLALVRKIWRNKKDRVCERRRVGVW